MSDSEKPGANNKSEDLDSLLDSALDDFNKPLPKASEENCTNQNCAASTANAEKESSAWASEFKNIHNAMQTILDDPEVQQAFEQLTNSAAASAPPSDDDFTASVAEALKGLAENAKSMPEPSQEDMAEFFNHLNLADGSKLDGGDQIPEFMPLMHTVMQSLLSKELLYPALKDIVEKYPDWLENKKSTLDEEQFKKYTTQYELMKQVCTEFENNSDESEEGKSESFKKILSLMQKMQDCGNPPKELVGDVNPELPFDEQGNMKLPGMPDQCTLM